MSFYERIARQDKIDRTVKLATTYLRKAEDQLYAYRGEKEGEIVEPLPPTYHHQQLLDQAFETALAIIERLPDDFFEETDSGDFLGLGSTKYNLSDDVLVKVNKVVEALARRRKAGKRKRLIAKLENTTGRSPEETALYQSRADFTRRLK